jgi:putative ABC transport system substrate-binding protein
MNGGIFVRKIFFAIIFISIFVTQIYAQEVVVTIDGDVLQTEVSAIIVDGRTMLPPCAIGEALGQRVEYCTETNTVIFLNYTEGNFFRHEIGTATFEVNGQLREFDVASVVIEGRAMVPVRMITEAIGVSVEWNAETRTAEINTNEESRVFHIGILQLVTHPALDSAREGFIAAFEYYGVNAEFDLQNADGYRLNASLFAERFVANEVDLIFGIASLSLIAAYDASDTIPIVGTAATNYEAMGLVNNNAAPGTNVTGTSDSAPAEAQIDMILEFLPQLHTLGISYNPADALSVFHAEIAISYAQSLGIDVIENTSSGDYCFREDFFSFSRVVCAIWTAIDGVHFDNAEIIREISIETGTPVFAGNSHMAEEFGIASIDIDYFALGYESGRMAIEILVRGANPADMPISFARGTILQPFVNGDMAEILGITIPERFADYVWFS